MRYVITGAAGNVSRPLAAKLLGSGHEVVVIGRSEEHLHALTSKGATARIGSVEDVPFLTEAFSGAAAVYTMVPPQYSAGDLESFREVARNYAQAIRSANVKYLVNLSSVGAHLKNGAGPVSGLYRVEEELNKLTDTNVLHLRAGFFYVNFFGSIGMVKHMNILGANYGDSNSKMILAHPDDIAEAAAEALLNLSFRGHSFVYVVSDERTTGEIARELGKAVGKPDLPWVEFTDEQAYQGMKEAGMPEGMAAKYAEMGRAMRTGIMWEDYFRQTPKKHGRIKLEEFAESFYDVYQAEGNK
jgi:uncharacterized protein YbjT (DUF2867 family)